MLNHIQIYPLSHKKYSLQLTQRNQIVEEKKDLFKPKGFNGIQIGGTPGGVNTETNTNERTYCHAVKGPIHGHHGGDFKEEGNEVPPGNP